MTTPHFHKKASKIRFHGVVAWASAKSTENAKTARQAPGGFASMRGD
jgi:hypothetical protein